MKFRFFQRALMLIGVITALTLSAFPQEFRATLTGNISDPNGAVVTGATVTVKNQQTNEEKIVTTSSEGNYTIPLLQPGTYTVSVEAQGFKRAVSDTVELHTADRATMNVALEVGGTEQTVTVNADAPLLESDTASRGQVIENARVTELPLVGRNPLNLATLAPGVTFNGNAAFQRPFDNGDNVNFSINGGINRHNDFLLDGTPNNSITDANASRTVSSNNIAFVPSAEATEEFKIQTNSYDAQYGRTGGGTINITIKSGGQDFHGSIYEFARRYQLNANSFSNNSRGTLASGSFAGQESSPRFTRDQVTGANLGGNKIDQYGFVVSGPLLIPRFGEGGKHFYNGREKTFFLFNFEKYKELQPGQGFSAVPTLLERSGNFSQSGGTIYDPLTTTCTAAGVCTRTQFPGNVIPANRISTVGQNIINGFSLPNVGTATQRANNFYLSQGLGTDDFHSYVARVDHSFSDNERVFVRFLNNRRDQFAFGGNNRVGLGIDQQGPLVRENYGIVVDSTTTISPTSILNVRLSYSRFLQAAFRQASSPFDATALGFSQAFSQSRPISIVPRITFNDPTIGIPEFGSRNPNSNITNTISAPIYLTKITGNHTFKFGGEYRHFQINQSGGSFNFGGGVFCFTNRYTARDPQNRSSGGAAFADLLLGAPTANTQFAQCGSNNGAVTQLENVSPTTFQWGYYAVYVQDDYKVTPKLTLNLGFRYDYEQPPVERYNRQNRGFAFGQTSPLAAAVKNASTTDCPSCANLTGGLLFTNVGGLDRGAFDPDRNNFQPRVGVAYQLNEKTVLRGGYGLFYFPSAEYGGATGFSVISAYTGFITSTNNAADQFKPRADALSNPFPNGLVQPTGSSLGQLTQLGGRIDFNNPGRVIPLIHEFSAGVQRELPFRLKLDVSYVGSRSRDILTGDAQGSGARNLNVLSPEQLARARQDSSYLTTPVTNPFARLIPGNAILNAATIARQNLLVPFPQFSNPNAGGSGVFIGAENVGKLWYNSLQASLEKRLSSGLVGVVSYTFSKNIGALGFLNDQDTTPTKSVVNFDSPHVLVASAVYQLPFGNGQHFLSGAGKALNLLVGGFEYNIIAQYRSGVPIDLPGNADLLADPKFSDQAFSNQNIPGTTASYFNNCVRQLDGTNKQFVTSASGGRVQQMCSNPAFALRNTTNTLRTSPFRLGNLRQPSATVFDMSLNKTFAFTERIRFQFRLEAFNAFNTPLFGSPNSGDANGNTFGVLNPDNSVRNISRQVQLGFKLNF